MISGCILILSFVAYSQDEQVKTDSADLEFNNWKKLTQKGNWMTGGTLSMKFKNSNGVDQLLRFVDKNESYDFVVSIDGAYAFKDHNFAGLAISYGQTGTRGVFTNSDGEIYSEKFFGNLFSFTPLVKNLTPIDKNGRFNIINQIEFRNQIERGIKHTVIDETLTRTQTIKYTSQLGIRPGFSVFVLRNVAFETTLNVAGVEYSFEKKKVTGKPEAKTESASINFKIDILQLNIGIFIYLKPSR